MAAPLTRTPIDPRQAYVLVVEDDVPSFVVIARLLAYMGVQRCEWKTTGWRVAEFARSLPRVDLILLDLQLPHEDGYEALGRIRLTEHLQQTTVVALAARSTREEVDKARTAGFDGFIAKPIDVDRFPEQIRCILRGEPVWDVGVAE